MDRKKLMLIMGSIIILLVSTPIQSFASPDVSEMGDDWMFVEENNLFDIVEQILEVEKGHPDWNEQQIKAFMDEAHEDPLARDGVIDIWNSLTDSEKKLVIRYPFDALKVNKAKDIATTQTESKFGYNGLGDRSDTFRHGIWNAEMTVLIGEEKAELFATAHEDKDTTGTESDGYLKIEHKNMDLHNNAVGRTIGSAHPDASESELSDIVYANIYQEQSDFIWLHE